VCLSPQKAMTLAAGAQEASPRSYSSPDEALLQRMAAARLSPQLLSLLMADAERVSLHTDILSCRIVCFRSGPN